MNNLDYISFEGDALIYKYENRIKNTVLKENSPLTIKRINLKTLFFAEVLHKVVSENPHNKFLIGKKNYRIDDMSFNVIFKLIDLPRPDYLQQEDLLIIPVYNRKKIKYLQSYFSNITKNFNQIDSFMLNQPGYMPLLLSLDAERNRYILSSYTSF